MIAALAIVLSGWFVAVALSERTARQASDRVVADPEMPERDWDRTMADLRQAESYNPGTEWSVVRAAYHLTREERRQALRIAQDVLAEEPDNVSAWGVVFRAAGPDGRLGERARREIERLNPLAGS